MIELSVSFDTKEVEKMLTDLEKKQIPFAASQALNDTAFDARKALRVQTPRKLDRPTKFTVDSFQVIKSKKRNLVATVFIEEKRWKYLKWQIDGGTRRISGRGTGVPVGAKLNKFGNIRGRSRGLVKGKKQFIATIRGVAGVWEKLGSGRRQVKLMVVFKKSVNYKQRLPYAKIVEGVARNKFVKHFNRRLKQALKTAR